MFRQRLATGAGKHHKLPVLVRIVDIQDIQSLVIAPNFNVPIISSVALIDDFHDRFGFDRKGSSTASAAREVQHSYRRQGA
jgi:hypothetical protein